MSLHKTQELKYLGLLDSVIINNQDNSETNSHRRMYGI